MLDVAFVEELERLFIDEFLRAAPLYRAASKIRFPVEDRKKTVTLYRGSLAEEIRPAECISDYEKFLGEANNSDICQSIKCMGTEAGILVDGLIRIENLKNNRDHDSRDTMLLKVTDILAHTDGQRNLQIFGTPDWIAYRFFFAAASIRLEYKESKQNKQSIEI